MEETHSKVVLEIEVVGGDVENAIKDLQKQYDNFNKSQTKGLTSQHKMVKETDKVREKSQGKGAIRTFLDALNKRERKEKSILNIMKQQEKLFRRMMSGGRGALGMGPLTTLFGGQGMGRGGMSMNRMFGGMRGMFGAMGRGGGAIMKLLGPLAMFGLPLIMAGKFIGGATASKIQAGHGMHMQEQRALAGLAGTGTTLGRMHRAQERGINYGYGAINTLGQARSAALQTGNASAVSTMQMYSRATGMDVGQLTGVAGSMARGGTQFSGAMRGPGAKAFERIYANAFASGLDKSRFHEVFSGVGRLVDTIGTRLGGDVESDRISDLVGLIGSTGQSGLTGARGMAVLQRMDQAIRSPGGGEHGQALMLQAFGFGKPGGNSTYYEAMKRQQQGIYGENNLRDMFAETARQYGGGNEQIMALSRMTGADYDVLEKLRGAITTGSGMEGMTEEQKKEHIDKLMAQAGGVEQEALYETKKMADKISLMEEHTLDTLKAGRLTSQRLLNIQGITNDLVRGFIPVAEKLLGVVEGVYRFMVNFWGSDDEKKEYRKEKDREIRDAYYSGQITRKEAEDRMVQEGVWNKWSTGNRAGTRISSLAGGALTPASESFLDQIRGSIGKDGNVQQGLALDKALAGYDVSPELKQKIQAYQTKQTAAIGTRTYAGDDREAARMLEGIAGAINDLTQQTANLVEAAVTFNVVTGEWERASTDIPPEGKNLGPPRWSTRNSSAGRTP